MDGRRLISLVGPTAVGKTAAAYAAAEQINQVTNQPVALISADSRQIYQGLEIATGADLPDDIQTHPASDGWPLPYFTTAFGTIHGVSSVPPTQPWSLADFQIFAQGVVQTAWEKRQVVILVGGTGLYYRHLFDSEVRQQPGPDLAWRQEAETLSLEDLQSKAQQQAPEWWQTASQSDRANARRLVRAVERTKTQESSAIYQPLIQPTDWLKLGLQAPLDLIEQRIQQRTMDRWEGAVQEVSRLLALSEAEPYLPALTTTGVKPLLAFIQADIDQPAALQLWITQERQYAKRQLTWWKKETGIKWFDSDQSEQLLVEIVTWLG